ncbi:MAG TPA: hypothetical protein VNT20_18545 [Flavisolibacter sp.]|nr:hypothetical protein [Flavisolibacter sp.]
MQENQNTNEQERPKKLIPAKVQESHEPAASQILTHVNTDVKQETPTPATQPPNIEPQTEAMEVHKHPHHVMHKKKWGEYLLEFFMIFFAVFLGFLAETIREHVTENNRAKEFASSMLKELQQDTAQLKSYNKYFKLAANNIDTLMQLLASDHPEKIPSGKLYWYGLWGGAHRYFVPNDATFQQMKSSGSLRFFNKAVAINVADYDRFCRLMQQNDEKEQGIYVEVRKSRAGIFDFRYNDIANSIAQDLKLADNYYKADSFMKTNPPLLSLDNAMFNQYVELVRSRFIRQHISLSDSLLASATSLIKELETAYSLKAE